MMGLLQNVRVRVLYIHYMSVVCMHMLCYIFWFQNIKYIPIYVYTDIGNSLYGKRKKREAFDLLKQINRELTVFEQMIHLNLVSPICY